MNEENNILMQAFIDKCEEVSMLKGELSELRNRHDSLILERATWTDLILESLRYSEVYDDLIFTDDKRAEILTFFKLLFQQIYKDTLKVKKAEYEAQKKREGVSE